jgi:hypothetical protein
LAIAFDLTGSSMDIELVFGGSVNLPAEIVAGVDDFGFRRRTVTDKGGARGVKSDK